MRLFDDGGAWHAVKRTDPRARAVVDGEDLGLAPHYSRRTPGAREFMFSGKTLVMVTDDGLAVWGAIENRDPAGALRWRVSVFRNEGPLLSSDLVREGTARTFAFWDRRYGRPTVPLRTEVNPRRVRRKRDPGRCFLRAGWRVVEGGRRGLVVLEAPQP